MIDQRNTLKIDTTQQSVSLDGAKLENINSLSIDWQGGRLPTVRLNIDCDIVVEGTLLSRKVEPITCDNCGYELGELAGVYSVQCPKCGERCAGF